MTRRKFISIGLPSLMGPLLFADSFWFERFFPEYKELDIGNKDKGEKIKLAQISDLHLRRIDYGLRSLAQRLNVIDPDLLLITGDSVDKKENLFLLEEFMDLIDVSIKKVAILGNWERRSRVNLRELKGIYDRHNCDLLINKTKNYFLRGHKITITGVDDYVAGTPHFVSAVSNSDIGESHIVLSHCPLYRDIIEKEIEESPSDRRVDFVLSGHTHGGQVAVFGAALFLPPGCGRYVRGWYKERKPALYVSKGIGTSILPIRLGARAEVTIFNYYL